MDLLSVAGATLLIGFTTYGLYMITRKNKTVNIEGSLSTKTKNESSSITSFLLIKPKHTKNILESQKT